MQLDIMTESHGVTLNMREACAMSPCLQYTGRTEKNVWVSLPHETLVFCSMSRTRRSVIRITRMRSHFCARMQIAWQATIDRGVLWRRKWRHKKIRASMGEFQAPALADFPSSWPAEVPALATPYRRATATAHKKSAHACVKCMTIVVFTFIAVLIIGCGAKLVSDTNTSLLMQ